MGWLYAKRSLRRGARLRQSRAPPAHKRLYKSAVAAVGVAVIRGGQAMMRLGQASGIASLFLLASAATASAGCAWVSWEHSHEVWVDSNKENHRRDGY